MVERATTPPTTTTPTSVQVTTIALWPDNKLLKTNQMLNFMKSRQLLGNTRLKAQSNFIHRWRGKEPKSLALERRVDQGKKQQRPPSNCVNIHSACTILHLETRLGTTSCAHTQQTNKHPIQRDVLLFSLFLACSSSSLGCCCCSFSLIKKKKGQRK